MLLITYRLQIVDSREQVTAVRYIQHVPPLHSGVHFLGSHLASAIY